MVVDVNLIMLKPFHIYYNNNFALQIYIDSQFCIDPKHMFVCSPSKH
jgi:hypothetical protein